MDNRAIGVFDSGLGGLTATQELRRLLPDEHIIYLSDSYNFPYGEKSRDRIIEMSLSNMRFLLSQNVKAIFVACGTATSNALEALIKESPVPVFGVVEPAVVEAVKCTENGKIGQRHHIAYRNQYKPAVYVTPARDKRQRPTPSPGLAAINSLRA